MKKRFAVLFCLLLLLPALLVEEARAARDANIQKTVTATGALDPIPIYGTGITYHKLTWNPRTVGLASCTVKLEKSVDGSSWSDLIAAQTCTTPNTAAITMGVTNFVRFNVTALSVGATLTVNYSGYVDRAAVAVPSDPTSGQLPIGKADGTWATASLTAGSNITITPGDGSITIAASGGGGPGSVTSVGSGSGLQGGPITSTGTLALGPLTADWDQTGAFSINLNNSGAGFKMLENGTSPSFFGIFDVADLSAHRTYLFPNADGTVITTGNLSDVTGFDPAGTAAGAVSAHAGLTSGVHGITSALGTAAFTATSAYEPSGAVSGHAGLTSGVHGAGAGSVLVSGNIGSTVQAYNAGTYIAGGTDVAVTDGGTGLSAIALGEIPYGSGTNTYSALPVDTTNTRKFLRTLSILGVGQIPAWDTVTKSDVGLGSVENTALSSWAGTSNITTVGTIISGTWHGTAIDDSYISSAATWSGKQAGSANLTSLAGLSYASAAFVKLTGANTFTLDTNTYLTAVTAHDFLSATHGDTTTGSAVQGDIVYADATPKWTRLPADTSNTRKFLRTLSVGGVGQIPAWDTVTKTDVGLSAVENTQLSTWAGSSNITTTGTVSTGTWNSTLQAFIDINRYGFMNQTQTTIAFDGTSVFTLGDAGAGFYVRNNANSADLSLIYSDSNDRLYLLNGKATVYADGGVTIGAPTGNSKGSGTLNTAGDQYKNNTAYTNPDYVFEKFYTGNIVKYASNEGASDYKGLRSIEDMEKYTKANLHLPMIDRNPSGIFGRADMTLLSLEEAYLYIFQLNNRITELEKKVKEQK